MNSQTATLIQITDVLQLIEDGRDAELARNLVAIRKVLEPLWRDVYSDPDFSQFPAEIDAELQRQAGSFLSYYGKSRAEKEFQSRGKDLLCSAIRLFEENDMLDKAAEARINLAFSYWLTGEPEECNLILDALENSLAGNELHPNHLRLQINRIMVFFLIGDLRSAADRLKSIETAMSLISQVRLLTMFHNQAGLVYQALNDGKKAVFHFKESIRLTKKAGILPVLGIALNNLAYFYKEQRQFEEAHHYIDESIATFRSFGDIGFLPSALDTKALIYLDEGRLPEALTEVDSAIGSLKLGADYMTLADAMWTKCRCLFYLDRNAEALELFAELYSLAAQHVGKVALRKYSAAFESEIFVVNSRRDLSRNVAAFKKAQIARALRSADNNVGQAAELLGLKSHQALSEILNKQFPELYDELGIVRRKRRSDAVKKQISRSSPISDRDFAPLDLSGRFNVVQFGSRLTSAEIGTYFCSYRLLEQFKVDRDCVVAVELNPDHRNGLLIVYEYQQVFYIGTLEWDSFTGLYCVQCPVSDMPLLLGEDVRIIGSPLGAFPVELLKTTKEVMFYPLSELSRH